MIMRIKLIAICCLVYSWSVAQPVKKMGNHVNDHVKFKSSFAVKADSDSAYDYYAVDMTVFKDRFERIYFKDLSFGQVAFTSIDSDVDKGTAWFIARRSQPEKEADVLRIFGELRARVLKEAPHLDKEYKDRILEKHKIVK